MYIKSSLGPYQSNVVPLITKYSQQKKIDIQKVKKSDINLRSSLKTAATNSPLPILRTSTSQLYVELSMDWRYENFMENQFDKVFLCLQQNNDVDDFHYYLNIHGLRWATLFNKSKRKKINLHLHRQSLKIFTNLTMRFYRQ